MTVTPTNVTTTPAATGQTSNTAADSQTQLSGNFNMFLQLLTTQMQNQDPLNPMDSSEFTNQLVQFSGVEQAIQTNQNLQSLISLMSANNLSNAMGYLGKEIDANVADMTLKNGSANWNYSLDATADETDLQVTDANGKVVYKTTGDTAAGDHTFTWDGRDNNGNALPDGTYTLTVNASTAGGNAVSSSVTLKGLVSDIDIVNGEPTLSVNGVSVPSSSVVAVHEPDTSQT